MFEFIKRKYRYERHKKACKKCKYDHCSFDCVDCKINPGDVLSCPCLSVDNSPKYSRCEYFELDEEVNNDKKDV